jgi:hypothetical protein
MNLSSKLYTLRKWLSDFETLASGDFGKIIKRFLIRKPLYKLFMKFLRRI